MLSPTPLKSGRWQYRSVTVLIFFESDSGSDLQSRKEDKHEFVDVKIGHVEYYLILDSSISLSFFSSFLSLLLSTACCVHLSAISLCPYLFPCLHLSYSLSIYLSLQQNDNHSLGYKAYSQGLTKEERKAERIAAIRTAIVHGGLLSIKSAKERIFKATWKDRYFVIASGEHLVPIIIHYIYSRSRLSFLILFINCLCLVHRTVQNIANISCCRKRCADALISLTCSFSAH